jgi:hypothetical protein
MAFSEWPTIRSERARYFPQSRLIIGAAVARRPLPHHRAQGSVHGGSKGLGFAQDLLSESAVSAIGSWGGFSRWKTGESPAAVTVAPENGAIMAVEMGPVCGLSYGQRDAGLRPRHRAFSLVTFLCQSPRPAASECPP